MLVAILLLSTGLATAQRAKSAVAPSAPCAKTYSYACLAGFGYGAGDTGTWAERYYRYAESGYHNCTRFVAFYMQRYHGVADPNLSFGNASNWGLTDAEGGDISRTSLKELGYRVDSTPTVGSIAWRRSGVGHVGIVVAVEPGYVTVASDNYQEPVGYTDITRRSSGDFTGYIHVEGVAAAPPARWQAWEALGTGLTAGPGVSSWAPGRLDVFWAGNDRRLWHRYFDRGWSGFEQLGGSIHDSVAAESWGPGRIDVFARGTDNTLQHKWFAGGWSSWEALATGLSSGPGVASWAPGRLDVFWVGFDQHLWHKWFDGAWYGPENLGGWLQGTPAAVSWGPGRIDIFARGTDDTLQHKWFAGGWSHWETLGTGLSAGPGVSSWASGRLDVFWAGNDHRLWHRFFDGGWSGFEHLGGSIQSAVSAVSWGPARIDVFARGTDDTLQHHRFG